jgi:hypothetical protein
MNLTVASSFKLSWSEHMTFALLPKYLFYDVLLCIKEYMIKWLSDIKNRVCVCGGGGVRVPGCKPGGPGFDSWRYQIFRIAVGLQRGPLSLMSINEELLERKVAAPV